MLRDRVLMSGRGLPVTPGSQTFTANGTFVVPLFNTLIVEGVGPGAGGGAYDGVTGANGSAGSQATFAAATGTLAANSGGGGISAISSGNGGGGGTATGGDVNTTGAAGTSSGTTGAGGTGAGPFGGAGGPGGGSTGSPPGGGGAGNGGGGGGGGGYVKKTYHAGDLVVGASIAVVTPVGGFGGSTTNADAGAGARSEWRISWS